MSSGAIITIILGLIFISFVVGGINLTDYLTQTAVGLTLIAVGVGLGLNHTIEYSRTSLMPKTANPI
jgi:hypothetical protein